MVEGWEGGWTAYEAQRRVAIASLTPLQRLEWLETTVTMLADAGLLAGDRARRQREADEWAGREGPTA